MSAQVSNARAGVDGGRQAQAASGAGGGRKGDERDGRKPPRKGPSRVEKDARRCFTCGEPGHVKKNCPYERAFNVLVGLFQRQSGGGRPQHAGPGSSRVRRRARRAAERAEASRRETPLETPRQESSLVAPRQETPLEAPRQEEAAPQEDDQCSSKPLQRKCPWSE